MPQRITKQRNFKPGKPEKPYDGFPLFAHASGRWCKKIRGNFHYFGKWNDPKTTIEASADAALNAYLDEKDDLHAGRTPRAKKGGLTVKDLVNKFMAAKRHLADTREITLRTYADYHSTCERILDAFGKNRLADGLATDEPRSGLAVYPQGKVNSRASGRPRGVDALGPSGLPADVVLTCSTWRVDRPGRKQVNDVECRLASTVERVKLFAGRG